MIECGDQGYARAWLVAREHGVCRRCGLDTATITRLLDATTSRARHLYAERDLRSRDFWRRAGRALEAVLAFRGFERGRSPWEADHIVPLIEGGSRGAENLQTLCVPCHRADTAALARRRAVARNPQRRLFAAEAVEASQQTEHVPCPT